LYSFTGGLDGAQPEAGTSSWELTAILRGNRANGLLSTNAGTVFHHHTFRYVDDVVSVQRWFRRSATASARSSRAPTRFLWTTLARRTNHQGVVFKMTPVGTLTTLWQFKRHTDGNQPVAGLVQGTNGNFYGTTLARGKRFRTVFTITPSGTLTTLFNFSRRCRWSRAVGGLVLGATTVFMDDLGRWERHGHGVQDWARLVA